MAGGKTELEAVAHALNSGSIHLLREMRVVDREAGLTSARLSALSVLVFVGPCSLGRLAAIEDVAGPTMTRIVDGLCQLDLAVREPHPDSARSVQISATAQGETLMRAAADRRIAAIVAALQELSDSELEALVENAHLVDEVAQIVGRRRRGKS
jgi:DNA-binding MarR family transcriptional regulator